MRWSDLLRMSVSSLRRRKLRTFLTVLGVVIGTASIVVMISLGLGLQESMYKEVEQNGGTTSITVTGKDSGGMMYGYSGMSSDEEESQKYITDDVIKELKNVAHVKSAEPILSISVIALKGKYEGFIELTGMTPEGLKTLNLELEDGGRLPDPNSAQLELVYGNTVITNFYEKTSGRGYWDSGELPDIDLQTDSVFLILDQDGYYQSQSAASDIGGSAGESGEGGTASAKTPPKKHVVSASGVLKGGPDTYTVNSYMTFCDINKLRTYLEKEFRGRAIPGQPTTKSGKPYNKFVYSSAIDSMKKQFAMVQAVLGGIGAVSLFVAAIGIANTMMMSIYERTKEIGVMKVIGCSLGNIRQMFLLEAAFIGLGGGVIGNVLSFLMSAAINALVKGKEMGMTTGQISYIPLWLVLVSLGFAMLVGTAAGYFPARRAMKLSPLAAIRNE